METISDQSCTWAINECINHFGWPPDIAEFKQLAKSKEGSSRYQFSEEVLKFPETIKTNGKFENMINEGAIVCKRLKNLYPDKTWLQISALFTQVKKKQERFTEI